MIQEENVAVERAQTEEGKESTGAMTPPEEASAVLGKFRTVDALARAYESLQAEFTRRSQRLRTLEKEVENFKEGGEQSGAEKLRRVASARRAEAQQFDAFVSEMEKPTSLRQEPEKELGKEEVREEIPQEGEEPTVGSGREETSENELFAKAFANEAVRLKIVGEYLSSLGKSGVPLTSGGVGVLTSPTQKAKSVGEAGNMALLYFKKPNLE